MGEVYRARDTKLNRDVAIKVLLPAVANDPDRLARFGREAQVLASLNHPNIAAIYGIEESGGVSALVMELVEGEDLAQRIARGPIPIDEALPIARQIAEALEAAHECGIIHRDLKPANIKVRPDGTVKVLDFGLAKQGSGIGDQGSGGAANSPTLSIHATEAGLILGTAAYMSPEQAAGKSVDKRSDLWSFGVVLMEMLTGHQVFKGETVSHLIAAVLKDEPDWNALPSSTPSSIRRLLRRCLEKDRKLRLPDAAVARLEIDDARTSADKDSGHTAPASSRWLWPALSFVIGGLLIGAAVWLVTRTSIPQSSAPVVRFALHDTDDVVVSRNEGDMALSPDGRRLAFVGLGAGNAHIWLREFDAVGARLLPGTEGAAALGWSPDGQTLAFSASGYLKRLPLSGGTPEVINARSPRGSGVGTLVWGADDTIFLKDGRGFWRAAADGSTPAVLVRSADDFQDTTDFLPGGRHVLISVASSDAEKAGTFVSALDGSARRRLLPFPSRAQYAVGHLLFVRERTLYAQEFDVSALRLTGTAAPLAESAAEVFSASEHGDVAFLPLDPSGRPDATELVWMDRKGLVLERIEQAAGAYHPVLSRDGRRLATAMRGDVWVLELARNVLSKVSRGSNPTWWPDNQRLLNHTSMFGHEKDVIVESVVGGTGTATVAFEPADGTGLHAHATDISPDGRHLAVEVNDGYDIRIVPLTGPRVARAFITGPDIETQGKFSPDGRWLSYTSNSSGRSEVYVQRFPEGGSRIQVSPNGGHGARWRRDGRELFYVTADGNLMAIPVSGGASIEFGTPSRLFKFLSSRSSVGTPSQQPPYDVTADGQRFIVSVVPRRDDPSIQVVLNWPALISGKTTP